MTPTVEELEALKSAVKAEKRRNNEKVIKRIYAQIDSAEEKKRKSRKAADKAFDSYIENLIAGGVL